MMLSIEQMEAAMFGAAKEVSWLNVDRPVGPQPIPAWCKGAHVDWADGYMNSPRVALKVMGNVRDWPDKSFVREGGKFYRARHSDGRMEQYAHAGKVSLVEISRFQSADGRLRQYRRSGPEWAESGNKALGRMLVGSDFVDYGYEPGEWVKVMLPATTAQEGFGGSQIPVIMNDGSEIVLRGPWHTSAPSGYAEVSYVDMIRYTPAYRGNRPWYKTGGMGGLYLRDEVFVAILARFQPHLPLVSVTHAGMTRIEPIKPEWDAPKKVIYEREWQAKQGARKAQAVLA